MYKGPNIFDFATSELSQDAFLCWLAQWADPRFKQDNLLLHDLGKQFLNACLLKHDGKIIEKPFTKIEIERQFKNSDILITINEKYIILIEDKVHTKEHSDQLIRYIEKIQQAKGMDRKDIYPIYYKTSDQSNVSNVLKAGYKIYKREDMLEILKSGEDAGIDDAIFKAYYDYLSNFHGRIQSYKELPGDQWKDNYPWIGFFTELQNQFGKSTWGEWGYVSNPKGGFLGFWWF